MTPAHHPLLDQLLCKVGASEAEVPSVEAWRELLGLVSQVLYEADQHRDTLERSIAISSREMQRLYQDLKQRTESERVEQDAIMRATLESAAEGIMVVDNERRLIAVNKRFAEMARLQDVDMSAWDHRVLSAAAAKSAKMADSLVARVERLFETGGTLHDEVEMLDGSVIDWFTTPVRTPAGTRIGRVAFFRDVTAERHAHQQLERAREAAEAASQAKSMFLANISHELRTPLTAVIGLADLLLLEHDPVNQRQREYLDGIASSGRHLLALVNDVLDLAKIEAGKPQLALQSTPLDELILDGVASNLPLANARGVVLEPAVIVGVPNVRADPVRLRQIFYNLISNAVKFTNRGGMVRVRAQLEGDRVAIAVIDTGIGIAPADLSRLYRSFEQLTLPSGDRPAGTGLGLALTKRLIELHGGTIDVESELGVGTTFTVRIPVG